MSWWKIEPGVYVFNAQDGTWEQCVLVCRDGIGRSIVRRWNGVEVSVSDELVTKDPAKIRALRIHWEKDKASAKQG